MATPRIIQNKNGLHFICIPKKIAKALNWRYGDVLFFSVRSDSEVLLTKIYPHEDVDMWKTYDATNRADTEGRASAGNSA